MIHRSAPRIAAAALAAFLLTVVVASRAAAGDVAGSLATFATDPSPWLHPAANSEQWQPLYLGASPREMALGLPPADGGKPVLPLFLRARGEQQLRLVHDLLRSRGLVAATDAVEIEAWPVHDDSGGLTWAMARWRKPGREWRWLEAEWAPAADEESAGTGQPVLPRTLRPEDPEDFAAIYADVLDLPGLYDKPVFGDCVWSERGEAGRALQAWRAVDERERSAEETRRVIARSEHPPVCRALPQPPRLNGKPVTFVPGAAGGLVSWPGEIQFKPDIAPGADPPRCAGATRAWPADVAASYRDDIAVLTGEREAVGPEGRGATTFRRKNNVQPDNQLPQVLDYLDARYRGLGLRTIRQEFPWRGMQHANLIAVLPGSDRSAAPVMIADHIDSAFSEDVFERSGARVSAPGADDNASATAALLYAAGSLRGRRFRRDIWLVHLTGEEYPADDLGARHFAGWLLAGGIDVFGVVVLDLVAFRDRGDPVFQVNPGDSAQALRIARTVVAAAEARTQVAPALRPRFDERSYLYNTDALIFADSGFPVVHVSEHINRLENFTRPDYHSSTDTLDKLDLDYAAAIVTIAVDAIACLAESEPASGAGPLP